MNWMIKQVFLSTIFLCVLFFSAMSAGQDTGPHGGVVKKAGDHLIEMNNPDKKLYCWLLDKSKTSISNKNITCEVKFFFPDNTILDIKALPFGDDGFLVENAGEFLSCQVTFVVQGKSITANFDSTIPVVRE